MRGRTLGGRYRIQEVVGSGGMGTVYEAFDVLTGDKVAIKSLNEAAHTTANLKRFRREAEVCSRLQHEHLCRIRHLGIEGGVPYIVMEHLDGETLRHRLRREGALSAADAIAITMQVLEALEAAHAVGVLHRDVKPSNILVTTPPDQPPRIKLIDFGLARPLPNRGEDESAITTTDLIPGTPNYLTPEQIRGERDLDERVDVWAAALTLFEMLTGRRMFSALAHYEELAAQILGSPSPHVSASRADVPPELDAVFARALAKDRSRRFRSAREFRLALVEVWARHRARGIARGSMFKRAPERFLRDETEDMGIIIDTSAFRTR